MYHNRFMWLIDYLIAVHHAHLEGHARTTTHAHGTHKFLIHPAYHRATQEQTSARIHQSCSLNEKMSGDPMDFLEELSDGESHLAATFYSAVGIVAVLVIVIIVLSTGYCCLARYIIRRNRYYVKYNSI